MRHQYRSLDFGPPAPSGTVLRHGSSAWDRRIRHRGGVQGQWRIRRRPVGPRRRRQQASLRHLLALCQERPKSSQILRMRLDLRRGPKATRARPRPTHATAPRRAARPPRRPAAAARRIYTCRTPDARPKYGLPGRRRRRAPRPLVERPRRPGARHATAREGRRTAAVSLLYLEPARFRRGAPPAARTWVPLPAPGFGCAPCDRSGRGSSTGGRVRASRVRPFPSQPRPGGGRRGTSCAYPGRHRPLRCAGRPW